VALCSLSFQITVCLAVNLVEDVHRHGFSVPQTQQLSLYCTHLYPNMISVVFNDDTFYIAFYNSIEIYPLQLDKFGFIYLTS